MGLSKVLFARRSGRTYPVLRYLKYWRFIHETYTY